MVCPKLVDGTCRITKKPCTQKYEIKMIKYKNCKIYKRNAYSKSVKKIRPRKVKAKGRSKSKLRSK